MLLLLGACDRRAGISDVPDRRQEAVEAAVDATWEAGEVSSAPFSDAGRDAAMAVACDSPFAAVRVGTVPGGPLLNWVGETLVEPHSFAMWDGATLKPVGPDLPPDTTPIATYVRKWRVVERPPDYHFADVYTLGGVSVSTPTPIRVASESSDLAIDDVGRVYNLATQRFTSPEPLGCGPGEPWYYLSPNEGYEVCDNNHLVVTVRHLGSGTVTALGDGIVTFAPNETYALIEPGDNKAGARVAIDKLTFDAQGVGHTKTLASHTVDGAAGPTAYAVATRTTLLIGRACDDAVLATLPVRDTSGLRFSPSGNLLLNSNGSTVYRLR